MRNVVVLSLAVLALAFVPVLAPANAPIFIDVPGLITIHSDGTFPNAFGTTLDAAVYDPDNADATLTWTYQDPDGNTSVNGVGPGVQLRTAATSTFDISTTHSLGVGASVTAADYAGTNAAPGIALATAGTATATKITVQCSDGTHMTEKDILVISNAAAGTDLANGITAVIPAYNVGATNDYSAWATQPGLTVGSPTPMAFTQIPNVGLRVAGTVGDNVDNNIDIISEFYGASMIGPGVGQLPVTTAVNVQQGKMYRMSTTVAAAGVAAGALHDNMKFRFRAGTLNSATYDLQAIYVNQGYRNLFPTSLGLRTPWWGGGATHTQTYDNVFCPPQEARFAGLGWGGADGRARNYRMFFDVWDIDGYFYEGDLTFSNTVLEELDRPEVGSNGYLAAWGAGAMPFNETRAGVSKPVPQAIAQAFRGELGWAYDAAQYTEWSSAGISTQHNDIMVARGLTPLGVGNAVTTATFQTEDPNHVELFSGLGTYSIGTWEIGGPRGPVGADFNAGSAIHQVNELTAFSNLVYYRATVTITGDATPANNPQTRIRLGNGFSQTAGYLVIAAGDISQAGPRETPTTYEVWWRGPSAAQADAGQPALNNMELSFQMMDSGTTLGDTWNISDVRIECFPVDYFDN